MQNTQQRYIPGMLVRQWRRNTGQLRITETMRAIQEEELRKKRPRAVRLYKTGELQLDEPPTMLIPVRRLPDQTEYHVINEPGRPWSLRLRNAQMGTLDLMQLAVQKCYAMTGRYPTAISISTPRMLTLHPSIYQLKHFTTKDGAARIPFSSEGNADYDVMVEYRDWLNS